MGCLCCKTDEIYPTRHHSNFVASDKPKFHDRYLIERVPDPIIKDKIDTPLMDDFFVDDRCPTPVISLSQFYS